MTLKIETAEALCSALYRMPFAEFMGETDDPEDGTHVAWFHLGEPPKNMRVSVRTPKERELVEVHVEWRNYATDGRKPLKCAQTLTVSTYAATQSDLHQPTTDAMLRVLAIYEDVLSEKGVAGKISDLQEADPDDFEEE